MASAVVSGTAKGADAFGEAWARDCGIQILQFPANWKKFGKRAGPLRNEEMADNADGLIAIWDGKSRGTTSMLNLAADRGLRIAVLRTDIETLEEFEAGGNLQDAWEYADELAAKLEFGEGLSRQDAERRAGAEALLRYIQQQDGAEERLTCELAFLRDAFR